MIKDVNLYECTPVTLKQLMELTEGAKVVEQVFVHDLEKSVLKHRSGPEWSVYAGFGHPTAEEAFVMDNGVVIFTASVLVFEGTYHSSDWVVKLFAGKLKA